MIKSKIPRTKVTKQTQTEDKNSLRMGSAFYNLKIKPHIKNGNLPDLDGTLEILSLESDDSTNLCLDYQLKSLNLNKKSVTIPTKMLYSGFERLQPLIVCAIDEDDNIYYTYLTKKFCKETLESTSLDNINIRIQHIIYKNSNEEQINFHRKNLIRICEFHKNKFNDTAVEGLLTIYQNGWTDNNFDIILERLTILGKFSFYRTDEGLYPVQDFIFKKINDLITLNFNDFSSIFIQKIVDLILSYKFDEPERVLNVLYDIYKKSNLDIGIKINLKKSLLEFSKYDYQTLNVLGFVSYRKLISLLEDGLVNIDFDLTCESYGNLLDLDYHGVTPTDNDKQYTIHRGVILYSNELKNNRLRILNSLFKIYSSVKDKEQAKVVITTINKSFELHSNPTSDDNENKIKTMLTSEKKLIRNFYIKNILNVEDFSNYCLYTEIEKGLIFSKDVKLKSSLSSKTNSYKLYSLLTLDMWRYRDISVGIDDVGKYWIEDFKKVVNLMSNDDIILVLNLVSNIDVKKQNDLPLGQIVQGMKFVGEKLLSKERKVTLVNSTFLLCPLLTGISKSSPEFFLSLEDKKRQNLVYYKIGALKFLNQEDIGVFSSLFLSLDVARIKTLDTQLFLASFEGLISSCNYLNRSLFKSLLLEYLSNCEELNNAKANIIDLAFTRKEISLDLFSDADIKKILTLYTKIPSLAHNTYGGLLAELSKNKPHLFVYLLSKRLLYKPARSLGIYYDAIPEHIDILEENRDLLKKEILELVKKHFKPTTSQIQFYSFRHLFKYINTNDIDAYILENIDKNVELSKNLLDQGLGSDDLIFKILSHGSKYDNLIESRLYQWFPSGVFYNEEEDVLIEKHLAKLKVLDKRAKRNKLIKKVIEHFEKISKKP